MSALFSPLRVRGLDLRNRVAVSPMCEYSAPDGMPTDWHLVHLGSFARGGAGLVFTEATAVSPEGRISPEDTGIWDDRQAAAWGRVTDFVRSQGAAPGIQLAHAGRKASTWGFGGSGSLARSEGAWQTLAPSAVPFGDLARPRAMDTSDIARVIEDFAAAARRAADAGFEVIEIHAAHGYLLHEFLSPLSNHRDDSYGGDEEGRRRLLFEVVEGVRGVWSGPLFVRVSASDWVEGGIDGDDTVGLAKLLVERGVDLLDCSSGGNSPDAKIPVGDGYQVPFARRVRQEAGMPSGAVGMITRPAQAESIVADGDADLVLLARAMLRDPHWALRAAYELGAEVAWPVQYERARWAS